MPQLDLVILFSQIFWLFFSFTLLYVIVLYVFLPYFLKSIKSRSLLLEYNSNQMGYFQNNFAKRSESLRKLICNSLQRVKSVMLVLSSDPNTTVRSTHSAVDKLISRALQDITLYCHSTVLKNISLGPRIHGNINDKK